MDQRECGAQEVIPQGYPALNTDTHDIMLEPPDMQQLRIDRFERNREVMEAFDPVVTNTVFPQNEPVKGLEEQAAICIQRYFRGYQGRKKYVELLYEQFTKEEKAQLEKAVQQVEEGELLVENHQLEVLLDDNTTTRRNKARHYLSHVITIQRAWKAYVRRKQSKNQNKNDKHNSVDAELKISVTSENDVTLSDSGKNAANSYCGNILDERMQGFDSRESTPDDLKFHSQNRRLLLKLAQDIDADSESVSSDYSEVSAPLRDIAETELHFVNKNQLCKESKVNTENSKSNTTTVEKHPGESDDDYSRRLRKINLLSIAQEFAELKKLNADALPFDLHKVQGQSSPSESSSASTSRISSEMNTPSDSSVSFENMKNIDNSITTDLNSNSISARTSSDGKVAFSAETQNNAVRICDKTNREYSPERVNNGRQRNIKNDEQSEKEGDFDVYNFETAVPQMDWERLEKQLQQATEEQKKRSESQRNDREEIRRKLAMGTGPEEEFYSAERTYKKPNLSARLQSGMNLQICFMNESPGEEQNLTQDKISNDFDSKEEKKILLEPQPVAASSEDKEIQSDVNKNDVSKSDVSKSDVKNGNSLHKSKKEDGDFFTKQARLQQEAKIALAQASTMAHMQLEVEKQLKKKSPIVDVVGIPSLSNLSKGQRFGKKVLNEMNIAQLQVVVNDFHSQIESLNEDLVRFLMERDELHMEQDSKLVDIEDLTRRAEERAGKVNTRSKKDSRIS